ncbi:hypothetical protein ACEZDB_32505 [Streptacidiphilus sp. N1-3]|uniref:Uncharacterized protein n=1 Tax=Streptacidiphilus alkalitolerans TaxID=3342712 RepID=A0ABV6XBE8_9ACTN
MRPLRFESLAAAAAATIPGAAVRRLSEADPKTAYPYGIDVKMGGSATRWQIVAVSAQGDKYDAEETNQVFLKERPEPPQQSPAAVGSAAHLETALAAVILAADVDGEFAAVQIYGETGHAISHGFTMLCHNGAKVMLNHQPSR